jgi:hypothetical protein
VSSACAIEKEKQPVNINIVILPATPDCGPKHHERTFLGKHIASIVY